MITKYGTFNDMESRGIDGSDFGYFLQILSYLKAVAPC